MGKCPECGTWNSLVETVTQAVSGKRLAVSNNSKPIKLSDIKATQTNRVSTGIGELDTVLGGGMSSRLWQNIREKYGLVYSVYSFRGQYSETGTMGVYAGTAPDKAEKVLKLIQREINSLASRGITKKELARAKEQLKGSVVLGLEDVTARMNRLGRNALYGTEILSINEMVDRVDRVSLTDVARVAGDYLNRPRILTVIGPFSKHRFDRITV